MSEEKPRDLRDAPKNGTLFIGVFGEHCQFVYVTAWHEPDSCWCCANLQANLYHGKWNDYYFETTYHREDELVRWFPMPDSKVVGDE